MKRGNILVVVVAVVVAGCSEPEDAAPQRLRKTNPEGAPSSSTSTGAAVDDAGAGAPPPSPGAAVVATVTVTPATPSILAGKAQPFTARASDQSGKEVPNTTFTWTASGGGTITSSGLFTAGTTPGTFSVTAKSGAISGTASITVAAAAVTTISMGETLMLNNDDSGNANLLLAQEATLAEPASLQSLSFFVAQAAGTVRFGVYDATGPDGGPGARKAETAEATATAGWMTVKVITPVLLPAGNYWLAYAPSDNGLHFSNSGGASGKLVYYSRPYDAMPNTFSTTLSAAADHWSFYATLTK